MKESTMADEKNQTHAEQVEAAAQAQADQRTADTDSDQDGRAVDPAAESAGAPDILQERLTAVGAKPDEIARLRDEYDKAGYQERMLANQQARGYDDATVYAYLENARVRWSGEGDSDQAARDQNVAVDSGVQVATTPAPDASSTPQQAAQPAGALRADAEAAGAPGSGLTQAQVTEQQTGAAVGPADPPASPPAPTVANTPTELELRQQVPTGPTATREKVMDWVEEVDGNDRVLRAQAALYVEQHTDGEEERKSLVAKLNKTIAG